MTERRAILLRFVAILVLAMIVGPHMAVAQDGGDAGLVALPATRERPLFSPTRRGPPPPPPIAVLGNAAPAQSQPSAPSRPDFRLTGVIAGTGRQVAIVTYAASPRTVNVQVGTVIDGWTVSSIDPQALTLRRDTETEVLRLFGR